MRCELDAPLVEAFVRDGYVKLGQAFDRTLAERCVEALWAQLDVDRSDRTTWTAPVMRIPGSGHPDLLAAINSPRLVAAIDELVGGPDRWQRRTEGYGTFPVRFPSEADPGDTGWHVDGSFGDPPHYRVNFVSRGRALLLLMLFTDVTDIDAPTRIKAGSHQDVARALAGTAADGVVFVPSLHAPASLDRPTVLATGAAGDVYLCHPFVVHAASWPHRGTHPRFVGQPCIHHPEGEWLGELDYASSTAPVAAAVRHALACH